MLFEKTPSDVQALLPVPIKQLGLKLEGSPIERYVEQLFKELDAKGLKHFRPAFYLTSEWGCPSEEPVIGVPFYLADPRQISPGGLGPPPPCWGHLKGNFHFYFQRGRPAQPFP